MFSLRTRLRVSKKDGHIPFLEDYSLSVLDPNVEYSPYKVVTAIRQSLLRIAVRSKEKSRNSLVVFRTSNPDSYFFHKNNDYIFLEMPKKKVALFYFYKRTFDLMEEARNAALELIKTHY